jgi:hypothetical protein
MIRACFITFDKWVSRRSISRSACGRRYSRHSRAVAIARRPADRLDQLWPLGAEQLLIFSADRGKSGGRDEARGLPRFIINIAHQPGRDLPK